MKRIVCCLLTLLLAACGPVRVVDTSADGTPILIRSPQPDSSDLEELKAEYGIKTILNLRGGQLDEAWFLEELDYAVINNVKLISVRLSGKHQPQPHALAQIYRVLENPDNWPILVHCQGGIHRTGLIVAIYRIKYQGWSKKDALDELFDNYFNWTITDRSQIILFIKNY